MSNHWRSNEFRVIGSCRTDPHSEWQPLPDDPARPFRWMPVAILAWAVLAAIWAVVWL